MEKTQRQTHSPTSDARAMSDDNSDDDYEREMGSKIKITQLNCILFVCLQIQHNSCKEQCEWRTDCVKYHNILYHRTNRLSSFFLSFIFYYLFLLYSLALELFSAGVRACERALYVLCAISNLSLSQMNKSK